MSDKVSFVIIILSFIILILLALLSSPTQNDNKETNTNRKPMIRIAPSGQPVTSPHGRTRIGVDIMTGKPILIL